MSRLPESKGLGMSRKPDLTASKLVHEFPTGACGRAAPEISVLRTEEAERKRISRELHDEIGQGLMALRLSLGTLVKIAEGPGKVRAEEAVNILDDTIEGLRRIIGRLSPRALEDLGLIGAIRKEANQLAERNGMVAHLTLPPREILLLSHETKIAVYRSVQEALHNISKHSGGKNFTVALTSSAQQLKLHIRDDGSGFSDTALVHGDSFGVSGMRERIEELGGTLQINSVKNKGTQIQIEIPLNEESDPNSRAHDDLTGKAS